MILLNQLMLQKVNKNYKKLTVKSNVNDESHVLTISVSRIKLLSKLNF